MQQLILSFECRCPTSCDCQCPDPDEGVALGSNTCPVHNLNPEPDPLCPVHGGEE